MNITHKTFTNSKNQRIIAYFISNFKLITVQYGYEGSKRQNLVLLSTFKRRAEKLKLKEVTLNG